MHHPHIAILAAVLLALAPAACGDGNGTDTDAATDTGGADGYPAGMPNIAVDDYVWTGCDDLPPNGSATDEMVSAVFVVEDFEKSFAVEGVQLEIFYNNDASGTPDLDSTNLDLTDADGRVTALVPRDRLIAYKVVGGETPLYPPGVVKTSIEYSQPTPDVEGGEIDAIAVSQATYQLITTVLGITPDPTMGILAGGFDDCAVQDIEGIVARLYNGDGTRCMGENRCLDRYFIDETPAQDQWWSSADGLFGVMQIPPADDYDLELHGIIPDSGCPGDMVRVGERSDIRIIANAITILDFTSTDLDGGAWTELCVW
ncbi:MAG: hypothetical protein JRG91_08815 [Deltaproteobacteria bacterium]|nr:hypothetical protein [Deltaproteobacteria bacterium]